MRILLPLLVLLSSLLTAGAEPKWQPLFNGKDLDGWHPVPGGKWEVVDGTILGTSPRSEPRHGLLMTDKRFKNFRVRALFESGKRTRYHKELTPCSAASAVSDPACVLCVRKCSGNKKFERACWSIRTV